VDSSEGYFANYLPFIMEKKFAVQVIHAVYVGLVTADELPGFGHPVCVVEIKFLLTLIILLRPILLKYI
jgi:hypothetical protein